jgi:predicted PurR-regulated permease PerM
MTWGIVLFLFALILIIFLLLPLTLQINDLEKKMNKFIESLDKRYSTERLRKAQIEKQKFSVGNISIIVEKCALFFLNIKITE